MDRGVPQRTWKKEDRLPLFKRETGLFYAAQKILFDQGCHFCITSVSVIVPCINTGNSGNRRNDTYKNCEKCHNTECCKTYDCSKIHICPPRPCRLLKSFTSHCPSIFPYNFSKGNPDFRVVRVVRGTVPLTTLISGITGVSWGRFL